MRKAILRFPDVALATLLFAGGLNGANESPASLRVTRPEAREEQDLLSGVLRVTYSMVSHVAPVFAR